MSVSLWNKLEAANYPSERGPPAVDVGAPIYIAGKFGNCAQTYNSNYAAFAMTSNSFGQYKNFAVNFWYYQYADGWYIRDEGGERYVSDGKEKVFFSIHKDSSNYFAFGISATSPAYLRIYGKKNGTNFEAVTLFGFPGMVENNLIWWNLGVRVVNGFWKIYWNNIYYVTLGQFVRRSFPFPNEFVPFDLAGFLGTSMNGSVVLKLGFRSGSDSSIKALVDNITVFNTPPLNFTGYDTEDGMIPAQDMILWSKGEATNETSEVGPPAVDTGAVTFLAAQFNKGLFTGNTGIYRQFTAAGFLPNNWTVRIWIKPTATFVQSSTHKIFKWYYDANNYITIVLSTNITVAVVVGGVTVSHVLAPGALSAGTLYHLAIVFDRGGIDGGANIVRAVLNGSVVASSNTATGVQNNTGGTIYIGGAP